MVSLIVPTKYCKVSNNVTLHQAIIKQLYFFARDVIAQCGMRNHSGPQFTKVNPKHFLSFCKLVSFLNSSFHTERYFFFRFVLFTKDRAFCCCPVCCYSIGVMLRTVTVHLRSNLIAKHLIYEATDLPPHVHIESAYRPKTAAPMIPASLPSSAILICVFLSLL